MMKKYRLGFSLAELLISLLIISIILAAAMPTVTRSSKAQREQIWRWTGQNNGIYFGVGSRQKVSIGINPGQLNDQSFHVPDTEAVSEGATSDVNLKFPSDFATGKVHVFINDEDNVPLWKSQIDFMTRHPGAALANGFLDYAGRLLMTENNIAMGVRALQVNRQYDSSDNFPSNNIAIGHYSLSSNTHGSNNTAVGNGAMTLNVAGNDNTAMGFGALQNNYNGQFNTAVGVQALGLLRGEESSAPAGGSNSDNNTAIGQMAAGALRQGTGNTIIGSGAASTWNQSSSSNTVIGYNACTSNGTTTIDSMTNSICLGANVGQNTGSDNSDRILVGSIIEGASGTEIITGHLRGSDSYEKDINFNVDVLGVYPADGTPTTDPTTGNSQPMFKFDVKKQGNVLSGNTAFVYNYMNANNIASVLTSYNNTASSSTAAAGSLDFAMMSPTGRFSVNAMKSSASGASKTEGTKITYNGLVDIATESNKLKFSTITTGTSTPTTLTFGQEEIDLKGGGNHMGLSPFKLNIDARAINITTGTIAASGSPYPSGGLSLTGDVTIGGTATSSVHIQGSLNVSNDITIDGLSHGSGNSVKSAIQELYSKVSGVPSDIRLKNISGDNVAGLDEINKIDVKNFTYKNDEKKEPHVGVIAQQLQKVFPNSVIKGEDGYLKIKTEEMFYAMVNSIKQLYAKVQDLTAKVSGLDKRITELEAQNKQLKAQNEAFEKRLQKLEDASEKK